jgi:hypothetical protein
MGPLPSLDNINLILFGYINNFLYICYMKKLFYYLIIRLTTRHAKTAIKIYESIYHPSTDLPEMVVDTSPPKKVKVEVENKNKKQEIIDSLGYLKAKPIKSKRDKGSISMLEGVLATMV